MNPALIIIDAQKGIDQADHWGGNRNNPGAEENIKSLLKEWRAKKFPVFIVQHCSVFPDSPFNSRNPGNQLMDFISVEEASELVQKKTPNAFIGTQLEELLVLKKVNWIILVGFVTNNSVEATARMSGCIGIKTTVVSDATACFEKKGTDGTVYPSELIHHISLSNLKDEYADIETTHGVLSRILNL